MNETHKQMREEGEKLRARQESLAKAQADGEVEKKKIDEEAAKKKAAIDAHIHAIASGEYPKAEKGR